MAEFSESITAFAPAFVKLQHALPKVPKSKTGQVGNQKTKYADFETTVDAIKEVLHEHGFAFLQPPCGGGGGNVSVTTVLLHESGEWMRDTLSMPSGGNGAQGVGSALTYCKRYGLTSILGIATEDDDGAAASQGSPQARNQSNRAKAAGNTGKPSEAVTKRVMAMFKEAGMDDRDERLSATSFICKRQVASWSEVTAAEADEVIGTLDNLIKGRLTVDYDAAGELTFKEAS